MSLVAFGPEERVTVGDTTLTLRLDFGAITGIEGKLERDMPTVAAILRSGSPPVSWMGLVIWFTLREHHPEVTLDQVAGLMFDEKASGKIGLALSALLDRTFPLAEDRKPKNARKRRGRSPSSAAAG